MQNLTPANGTEVQSYPLNPTAGLFDAVMAEGHQLVDAFRTQMQQAPAEKLDHVPGFSPSFSPAPSGPRR